MLLWLFVREALYCKQMFAKKLFRHKCQDVCTLLLIYLTLKDNVCSIEKSQRGKMLGRYTLFIIILFQLL